MIWEIFTIPLASFFFKPNALLTKTFFNLEWRLKFSEKYKLSFNFSLQIISALYSYYLDNK